MCPEGRNNFFSGNSSESLTITETDIALSYGIGDFAGFIAEDVLWPTKDYQFKDPLKFVLIE